MQRTVKDDLLVAILESITDAFFALDRSWRFTYINSHAQRVLDRTAEQLLGKVVWAEFPGLDASPFGQMYRRVMAGGGAESTTDFYPDHDRWYETHAYPSAEGLSVYFRDVSERHRAEQSLRRSEERYRTLFNSIDEGFAVIEMIFDDGGRPVDYRFLEINPAFEKHTGIRGAAGRSVRELGLQLEPHWFETYGRVAVTGEQTRFTQGAAALDGRWFDVHAFRLGGPESRKVALLFSDITQRRRAEEALRGNEQHLQLAVDIARMGTFEIDLASDAVSVNESGRLIYGWGAAEPLTFGKVQEHFHPDDRDRVLIAVEAALDPAGPGEFEVEQRIFRVDGRERWIRVRGRTLFEGRGADRRAARCVGTYLDITEAKRAEDELRRVAAELSEADRRKNEFLATLAHELRNPLAPIRTGLELLKLQAGDPAAIEETRGTMERQVGQMVRLIDDLLDISRITQGKLTLQKCPVSLAEVLRSAVEATRPMIDEHNHRLSVALPEGPLRLEADPNRLVQIFANLLNNAAKYTEDGGRIWLSAEAVPAGPPSPGGIAAAGGGVAGGAVRVSVRDNGLGVPGEMRERIFEMFAQIDRPLEKGYTGLGIGLTLVKRLVEMHGGSIEVRSDGPGRGSEFVVLLPLGEQAPGAAASSVGGPAGQVSRLRVLVVDDNADAAKLLSMVVTAMGNDVRTAHDGEAAVAAAEQFRPQLVLMDLGMPKMNGYEAVARIRRQSWGGGMMVVALTGWGQEEDKRRTREAGFDDHLVKPAEPAALRAILDLAASR